MPLSLPERVTFELEQIEIQLKVLGLYTEQSPSAEAMASTVPFAYDQMLFTEWLQWVLLPKTRALISADRPLPTACDITPLAEEEFLKLPQDTDALLAHIEALDALFQAA